MMWRVQVSGRRPGSQGVDTETRVYDVEAPDYLSALHRMHDIPDDTIEHRRATSIGYMRGGEWIWTSTFGISNKRNMPFDHP